MLDHPTLKFDEDDNEWRQNEVKTQNPPLVGGTMDVPTISPSKTHKYLFPIDMTRVFKFVWSF